MAVKEGHKLATAIHDVEFVNSDGLREYAKAGVATEFPDGEYDKLVEAKSIRAPKNKAEEKALEQKMQEGPRVTDPVVQQDDGSSSKATKVK